MNDKMLKPSNLGNFKRGFILLQTLIISYFGFSNASFLQLKTLSTMLAYMMVEVN